MSFASRLWPALPLLAAVTLAPAGNAAAACPEASKLWNSRIKAAASSSAVAPNRVVALNEACPQDCARQQPEASNASEREARAPLPLTLVTRAEDVADWHAGIFERLRGERFEEGATRYCAATPSLPVRRL
jgi:hypothetical protein